MLLTSVSINRLRELQTYHDMLQAASSDSRTFKVERNGSETARETAVYRPRSRPALLLEVINDRGELHCHRTRHRGGRALPVPGCPQGRFPRRSTLKSEIFLKKK
jgi:hypothetical protein